VSTAPAARGQQLGSNELDDQLTIRARAARPKVRHWWGRRWHEGANGALCYLCGSMIATWSRRWPITETAMAQIALHRQQHLQASLDDAATSTEENR